MCGTNSGGTGNSVGVGAVKPGEIMAKKRKSAAEELTKRTQDPTVVPEVVEFFELTPEEQKERQRLERIVGRSFVEAGQALAEIRARRLYRSTHKTFETYCQDRFGFSRRYVNYRIAAVQVVDNLKMGTNGSQNSEGVNQLTKLILPTNERQVRPLVKLDPEEQREAWQQAVEHPRRQSSSSQVCSWN